MEILKAICILLLLFVIGLSLEWLLHPKADLKSCVYHIKDDFWTVVTALFTKEKPQESQNIFGEDFQNKMQTIVEPYRAAGMDTDVFWTWDGDVRCAGIHYVPGKTMDAQELQKVTDLLKIAFRRHLTIKGVSWRNFAYYVSGPDGVTTYICCEEFVQDKTLFLKKYRELVKEKAGLDFGCLRDEELDRQLGNV